MGRLGIDFVDAASVDAAARASTAAALMVAFVWDHLACDDERAGALAGELGVDPAIGRLLMLRGIDRPGRTPTAS